METIRGSWPPTFSPTLVSWGEEEAEGSAHAGISLVQWTRPHVELVAWSVL